MPSTSVIQLCLAIDMAVVTYPLLSECNSDRLPDIELDRWRKSGMH